MLNADLYLQDETSDFCWTLPVQEIQQVQEAFVGYMEEGLSFEQLMEHMESHDEEFFFADTERVKDATRAMCAVALSIPHPRILDLVGYIADIGADYAKEIQGVLDTLFEFNLGRKVMVIKALDYVGLDQFIRFSGMTAADATLIALLNDKELTKKVGSYLDASPRKEGILNVLHTPGRVMGWVEGDPARVPHAEVLARLARLAKAISGFKIGSSPETYDRKLWDGQIDVGDQWCLEDLLTEEIDFAVLDMPETKQTIALFPSECVSAISAELKSQDPGQKEALSRLTQTFLDAGVSGEKLFYMLCRNMTHIEYTDFQEREGACKGDFIREAINYTQSQWPLLHRQMVEHIISQEPVEDLVKHCFSDRLLNAAYNIVQDKRLLVSMQSQGRDQAIATDLGL
ncbi:hypothetical protein [Pseudomonas amygdali]